ncbi:hypothetical protein A3L04_06925 [Thermococcus chitonophagus]|uniref:Uncharacterized protein n=1 Tax=Thermococcus chitonophagus TaxID=54262 RepID=A0A160VU14_9EURY|nr:hypothetical protein [Thermococcus chitonophagus]ASJ16826.1 hypothetical protein A3L04_06925 [Thermococcus chitonophagus]CUX78299.1 hypothetical protein CHITON_1520 [Thermococcus chitonophagus]
MPRGMGRGYGRGFFPYSPFGGLYWLIDVILLVAMLCILFKLFLVAAPYVIALVVIMLIRSFLRPRPFFGPRSWF